MIFDRWSEVFVVSFVLIVSFQMSIVSIYKTAVFISSANKFEREQTKIDYGFMLFHNDNN